MITGVIKNKIDKIWTDIWAGGITNPLTVIEQLTYLMFIRSLDEKELESENFENLSGEKQPRIFSQSDIGQSMHWSRFKNYESRQIYDIVSARIFPAIKKMHNGQLPDFDEKGVLIEFEETNPQTPEGTTAFARYMSDALSSSPHHRYCRRSSLGWMTCMSMTSPEWTDRVMPMSICSASCQLQARTGSSVHRSISVK